MERMKRIHFIGIGGAGMGGIAEVLLHQGYEVTGSDPSNNAMTQRLQGLCAKISQQHQAENILGADVVVVSSAITQDNPEVVAARQANIPVIQRAEMLAELMRSKSQGIAVAGTHGKTTTTSLVTSLLIEGGLDPTYVIGGLLKSSGTHAHLGQTPFFIAEADESDASFLHLHPRLAIVTNIDADHLSTYGGDFTRLCATFVEFLHRLPPDGLAVVCIDDPVVARMLPCIERPVCTYGFDPRADIHISAFRAQGPQSQFTLTRRADGKAVTVTLNLMGKHNALNAAAAYAIANTLGVADDAVQRAFSRFAGVGRRLQMYGELTIPGGSVLLIDDYGHHPSEITVTWAGIRQAWPGRRLVVVYQPHRYSRTQELFGQFVTILATADQLLLLPVYSAGEQPIAGADSSALCDAIRQCTATPPLLVTRLDGLMALLRGIVRPGDIVLTQGAGSIGAIAPQLAAEGLQLEDGGYGQFSA